MAKLPDGLLNELRAAFERETKRLCRDAASILKVPEAELARKVKESMATIKLNVLPEDDELPRSCLVLLKRGTVLERCRGPCVLGTGKCLRHQTTATPMGDLPQDSRRLTRLERTSATEEPMWCEESTRQVYNRHGDIVGEMNEDDALELFVLKEDDEEENEEEESGTLDDE
jgi:hypothetical protein